MGAVRNGGRSMSAPTGADGLIYRAVILRLRRRGAYEAPARSWADIAAEGFEALRSGLNTPAGEDLIRQPLRGCHLPQRGRLHKVAASSG